MNFRINKFSIFFIVILFLFHPSFSYGQELDTLYHEKLQVYGEQLVSELQNEIYPFLSRKERKRIEDVKIRFVVSADFLEVESYRFNKADYIDISTAFLDALIKTSNVFVMQDVIGKRKFAFDYLHKYFFGYSDKRPAVLEYFNLNSDELKLYESQEIKELRGITYKYGLGFVIIHELAHHIQRHTYSVPSTNEESRKREREADEFAYTVFDRCNLIPVFAAVPLTVLYLLDTDAIVNERKRTHPADINRLLLTYSKNYEYIYKFYSTEQRPDEKAKLQMLLNMASKSLKKINQFITRDENRTFDWYKEKAEEGLAYAQLKLGHWYTFGENGLKIDFEQAMYWLDKAARQGDSYSQYRLGMMYEHYREDFDSALYWYHESAKQGNFYAKKSMKRIIQN